MQQFLLIFMHFRQGTLGYVLELLENGVQYILIKSLTFVWCKTRRSGIGTTTSPEDIGDHLQLLLDILLYSGGLSAKLFADFFGLLLHLVVNVEEATLDFFRCFILVLEAVVKLLEKFILLFLDIRQLALPGSLVVKVITSASERHKSVHEENLVFTLLLADHRLSHFLDNSL